MLLLTWSSASFMLRAPSGGRGLHYITWINRWESPLKKKKNTNLFLFVTKENLFCSQDEMGFWQLLLSVVSLNMMKFTEYYVQLKKKLPQFKTQLTVRKGCVRKQHIFMDLQYCSNMWWSYTDWILGFWGGGVVQRRGVLGLGCRTFFLCYQSYLCLLR